MKVKSDDKKEFEFDKEIEKKILLDYYKEYFGIKGNVNNIKIYSRSTEIFDLKKNFNKNDTPVDSELNNIKD